MKRTLVFSGLIMAALSGVGITPEPRETPAAQANSQGTPTKAGVKPIDLPPPQTDGGMPLMQALKARKSSSKFADRMLSAQTLSNLLWAAVGINRPDGQRTSSTAAAAEFGEIDVYVITADGLYLYEPKGHKLIGLLSDDLRALAGKQDYVKTAPVNLIYVKDFTTYEAEKMSDQNKFWYSGRSTALVGQNVYLYCASEGLATILRAGIDREALSKAMRLRPEQRIIFEQPVGYPQ
jgi:hypothetical protein